jgi:hypothetical protein
MRGVIFSLGTLSILAGAPASAAGPESASSKAVTASAAVKSPPNFDAMFAFVDKLFPPQPDPDPARLALARTSVQSMWPQGAYGQMMTDFMGPMFDRMMQLKTSDFAAMGAKTSSATSTGKGLSLHDQVAGKDPYFDKRVAAMRQVVAEELGTVSAIIDPRMREGLARALARRFDAQQLSDLNCFFATPTGHAFAGQYMQLWIDPDTVRSIFSSMPDMMKLMPEMMDKFKAANDKFPKPPEAKNAAVAKTGKH